ncbi:MAG: polysaccharide pyruvyl transferase family protein [Lachnospiraceae bacterium]|nr:polysaccharide pyruvyl transferase family protein [Lachnospiraceae bacterium]
MKKYIAVTGGQLFNKGAQAMTFITADEVAKRFPDLETVVISNMDARRSVEEKEIYTFPIIKYPKPFELILMQNKLGRSLCGIFGGKDAKKYIEIMENTAAVIDISGYSLGSDWGYKKTVFYLTRLKVAYNAGAAVYLMPQSFGPFDYKGIMAPFIHGMIRRNMRKVNMIMCREKAGHDLLKEKYGLENMIVAPDLVLQNMGVNTDNIYKKPPVLQDIAIEQNSVAIIPNQKTMLFGNPEALSHMYKQMLDILLKRGKTVYLLYHSSEDLSICEKIKKELYPEDKRVILVTRELSCLEFDTLVSKFDFIIASRFHAVVHAYRNAIPCIVPGWAIKYKELMELFGQGEFMFDVKGEIREEDLENAVALMCDRYQEYSHRIEAGLKDVRKKNVYEYIDF